MTLLENIEFSQNWDEGDRVLLRWGKGFFLSKEQDYIKFFCIFYQISTIAYYIMKYFSTFVLCLLLNPFCCFGKEERPNFILLTRHSRNQMLE